MFMVPRSALSEKTSTVSGPRLSQALLSFPVVSKKSQKPAKGLISSSQDETKEGDVLAEGEEPMFMRAEVVVDDV